jgi:hypothetical protein
MGEDEGDANGALNRGGMKCSQNEGRGVGSAGNAAGESLKIPAGGKVVGIRRAQICVKKLAANSSVCGVSECAALPLKRVTTVVKLASTEFFSCEHSESTKSTAIKL